MAANYDSETVKDYSHLKEWLSEKLDKAGMSVEQLSMMSGVSRAGLYFYMQDTYRPSEPTMKRICAALDVPFEEGLRQYIPRPVGRPKW